MWNAELRLRTFKPQEALPYEYKALRLLKDLQQKSRAYVAKTGVKLTPLDPGKRLKGSLDGIGQPVTHASGWQEPSVEDKLRMALSILDAQPASIPVPSREILREAEIQLARQASGHPADYLEGLQALKRLLGDLDIHEASEIQPATRGINDARRAQLAIRKLVPMPEANPSAPNKPADAGLSQLYFDKVNKQ